MKKHFLFVYAVFTISLASNAQTVYWQEDFDVNQGWTLQENWSFSAGKIRFNWTPTITNFDLSAISPTIDLIENTKELYVNQHLDAYNASNPPEAAEIYLIAGGNEYLLWDYTLNYGDWGLPSGSDIAFDISEFAGQTVKFRFRTYGPSTFQWNWWDVFNLKLTALFQKDLAAISVDGPMLLNPGETGTWNIGVKNLGSQPQNGFTVTLFNLKDDYTIGTLEIQETIAPQQTINLSFDWTPDIAKNTALSARVELPGDEFEANDISKSYFVRIKPEILFNVLVWDNDNGIETITDPEVGDHIEPSTALTRALDNTGISYQLVNVLPTFLDNYDIIFATMGCYCLS